MERLSDFYVLVSDEPFVSTGLATTLSQPGVSAYFHSGAAGISKIFDVERTGRYVRVQLNGKNYLHMAEVEVWARPEPGGASSVPWRSSEGGVRPESKSPEEREPLLRCAGLGSQICFALALAGYFDLEDLEGTRREIEPSTPAPPVARRTRASASGSSTGPGVSTLSSDPRRYSLYSPEMSLLAETEHTTSATPPIQYEYVWFAGAPVAQLTYSVPSEPLAATEVVWTVTDHLGTPKIQTGATGEILWHAEHEPYGQVYVLRAGEGRHQPLRFPGQEAEQLGVNAQNGVSDRSYNIFRWYRAEAGRYSQSDPKGINGGPNPYGYAGSNPARFIDPFGLAYFAKRPLKGSAWLGPFSCNPLDDWLDTEISHEQLFFEDGKSPADVGFFADGALHSGENPADYKCKSGKYDDCVMRKAVQNVGTPKPYCLLGKFGPTEKFNCQDWATLVRKEYAKLWKNASVRQQCCKQKGTS
jgi:RHS repeat-associated protein